MRVGKLQAFSGRAKDVVHYLLSNEMDVGLLVLPRRMTGELRVKG
jgi:hypothetical protein